MRLDLDIQQMRSAMALWRETAAIRPGLVGVPANADRAKLLTRAAVTVDGWLDLLRMCSAEDADLQAIRAEIGEFLIWARQGEQALRLLDDVDGRQSRDAAAPVKHGSQ